MDLDETAAAPNEEDETLAEIVDLDEEVLEDEIEDEYEDEDDFDLGMEIGEAAEDEEGPDAEQLQPEPAMPDAALEEAPAAPAATEALAIDPGQLEAALEKAVEKAFAGKIEQILVSVVEKTVKNEISRLRDMLMDED